MNSNSCEIFPHSHPSEPDDSQLVVDDFASVAAALLEVLSEDLCWGRAVLTRGNTACVEDQEVAQGLQRRHG